MLPQPETNTVMLFDQIVALPLEKRHDRFVLNGFEKKAEELMGENPAYAHSVLGAVSALGKKTADMKRHHENSIKLNSSDPVLYANYSASLWRLGFFEESVEYAKRAYEPAPDDLHALSGLIDAFLMSCRYRQAKKLLGTWNRLSPNKPADLNDLILGAVNVMDEYGLDDDDTARIPEIASRLIRDRNIYIHRITGNLSVEEPKWIVNEYILDVHPDEIIELEKAFWDELKGLPDQTTEALEIDFRTEDMPPYRVSDEEIKGMVAEYEKQYGMKSEEFRKLYTEGKIEDTFDTNFWKMLLK